MNAVGRGKTLEPPSPVPSEIQDVINSGDQIDLLRLKLGELQTALQSAFEKGDLTGAIRIRQQIASVEAEIRKLEEAANEAVPTMGRFREALSSIGSFLGKYAGTAEKVFSAFGKVLAFPFARAAKDIGGYAKSLGDVGNKFKRILGYRIIRSLIKEIEQAFGEGIKNLYGWSKAMGGATISGKNFARRWMASQLLRFTSRTLSALWWLPSSAHSPPLLTTSLIKSLRLSMLSISLWLCLAALPVGTRRFEKQPSLRMQPEGLAGRQRKLCDISLRLMN
jgi:hypothetical protein